MAVYTEVSIQEARTLMRALKLGELTTLAGCVGGIENTNYFVSTELNGQQNDYVLTLFERMTHDQLSFYLRLMKHLAQRGILVPEPHANAKGALAFDVKGKPAVVVNRLRGISALEPTAQHCALMGEALAKMHLAARDFDQQQPNLRALPWWNETVPMVLPYLKGEQATLIRAELAYQNHIAATSDYAALPRGPVHADLFRDNVLFDTVNGAPVLSGMFDFYFAGIDAWVFDLAVCLNDWCIDPQAAIHQTQNAHSFVAAYSAVRPLQAAERSLLPAMLRAAALRFWISRLWDFYLPREASLLTAHDPGHFERVLQLRTTQVMPFNELMGQA